MARILLVEDNEMNRDMLRRRLERRGFEVSLAMDGAECIEVVRSSPPELILMDMSLPVMDGYQATRILKAGDQTREIPILGLSAHAMTGDAERALEAGCDDYDTKPIEFKRLLLKIKALLPPSGTDATEMGLPATPDKRHPAPVETAPTVHRSKVASEPEANPSPATRRPAHAANERPEPSREESSSSFQQEDDLEEDGGS